MHCSWRLIVGTLVFSRSYLHRQVSPPETLVVKGRTTWARNGRQILPENARLPRNIQGSFTCRKSTIWDKRLYFPSEGRRAEDFFALKNPTASAGFEPANLGTKDQHATSRPPKPLFFQVNERKKCQILFYVKKGLFQAIWLVGTMRIFWLRKKKKETKGYKITRSSVTCTQSKLISWSFILTLPSQISPGLRSDLLHSVLQIKTYKNCSSLDSCYVIC